MKKICVFFLALAVFLLPEMVYAANATPQAVNMPHVYIVFGVLFVAAVLFFTEWIPLAVTSILVPCALSTLGVITVKEAWVSFGDTSILTIVGLFMLGEATFATGFAQRVATSIINKAGASETRLLVFSILLIARKAHLSPSRILLPTAYAASFGGCISLVGQAPSMVANGILAKMAPEYGQFAFFEFAWFGLPLTLLAALLFGLFPRFLVPPTREDVAELKEIETPEGGIHMWIAGGIYFLVIICMATGLVPLTSAAMLGAMLCVITRCMTLKQAQAGIDWTTVWLFAGMLSMSFAMNKSGAAQLIADFVVSYFSDPYILFGVLMLVTSILTNIMSNTATTAIMVPLVIPIALGMNLSPLPFVMGIAMSAAKSEAKRS